MERKTEWKRVSRAEKCPICDKPDWCSVAEDGTVAHCMRLESTQPVESGGWIHRLTNEPIERPAPKPKIIDTTAAGRWNAELEKRRGPTIAYYLAELAKVIDVSLESLNRLRIGYDEKTRRWWMPERDEYGSIVGINARGRDGKKICVPGSKRGLTYADGWQDSDSVMLVEGASDTASALTAGLSAIGRPSNIGGCDMLATMLYPVRWKRIFVFGENDRRKQDELPEKIQEKHKTDCEGCQCCWPGRFGSHQTMMKLREARIEAEVVFPPDDIKDFREWMKSFNP